MATEADLPTEIELPRGLTEADRDRIERHGLTVAEAARQLKLLRHEPPPIHLDRPCRVGDGILRLSEERHTTLQDRFHQAAAAGRFAKFVPASGAATRMFRRLLAVRGGEGDDQDLDAARKFLAAVDRFPFRDELAEVLRQRGANLDDLVSEGRTQPVLEALLDEPDFEAPALGYGSSPKALIPFHRTADGARTPLDEHVEEAADHLRSADGVCIVHFTIPQHQELDFRQAFRSIAGRLEARFGGRYELSCSIQRPATDTLAIEADRSPESPRDFGSPVRDADGELLFRPGGHGALLANLGEVAAETGAGLVFVRTIDNVLPADQRREVLLFNRVLGGYLLELEAELVEHLGALERAERAGSLGQSEVDDGLRFAAEKLNLPQALDYMDRPLRVKHAWLVDRLDRPLRVCGMVEITDEPGGGPFWVRHPDGTVTPQIVEQAQVDRDDPEQKAVAAAATHFSPANMVCRLRSHRGAPYDLDSFVDPDTVLLSTKSYSGRPIRVLERPGLWNGGMALWNTVFIEIPGSIFAPVKTVFDLLRPAHQPAA
jgi:hypothetical protein